MGYNFFVDLVYSNLNSIFTISSAIMAVIFIFDQQELLGVSHLYFWVPGRVTFGEGMKTFQRIIGGMKLSQEIFIVVL